MINSSNILPSLEQFSTDPVLNPTGNTLLTSANVTGPVTVLLPPGLATEAKQDDEIDLLTTIDSTLTDNLDAPLSTLATEATLLSIQDDTADILLNTAAIELNQTDGSQKTQLVNAANVEIGTTIIDTLGDWVTNGTITGQLKNINDRVTSIDNLTISTFDTALSNLATEITLSALSLNLDSVIYADTDALNKVIAIGAENGGIIRSLICDNSSKLLVHDTNTDLIPNIIGESGIDNSNFGLQIAGNDGTNIIKILVDSDGKLITSTESLIGDPLPFNGTLIGGRGAGDLLQAIQISTTGKLEVEEFTLKTIIAENSIGLPASSLLIGGSDGTFIQPLKVESDGTVHITNPNLDVALSTLAQEATLNKVILEEGTVPATIFSNIGGGINDANKATSFKMDGSGNLKVALTGGQQTITSTSATGSGNVPAGAKYVSFVTNGTFAGTINGTTRLISSSYIFRASEGSFLPQINYTVTVGAVSIDAIS